MAAASKQGSEKESLALDVEALRRKLGPVKVALIEQWIREVNGPLNVAIAQEMHAQAVVLDAGCSRGDPDLPALKQGIRLIGSDMDLLGLRANSIADDTVLAPLGRLPFRDASFDVVVCKWVLEHLEHPEQDFREVFRVLKPGGAFVALTPNAHSAFTLISRSIPYRMKQLLKGNMFGVHEEDTFRTWYRANSRKRLERLAAQSGLHLKSLHRLPGMWTFFIFLAPLARMVRSVERLQMRVPGARAAATYLVAVWQKPKAEGHTHGVE